MACAAPRADAEPRLRPLGDSAVTVEFGTVIDADLHARVMGLMQALEALCGRHAAMAGVEELMASFSSLTVHFDPDVTDVAALEALLLAIARRGDRVTLEGRQWHLPVCFDLDLAPDLADLATLKGLTQEAVVHLLTAATFRVFTIGFLPGFPYMGGLPEALEVPRLTTPRPAVPARSIAIAGSMCAAYPWVSPGGWWLVGRMPLRLFDGANEARPALLAAGDAVRWQAINREAFDALEARDAAGTLDPSIFLSGSPVP